MVEQNLTKMNSVELVDALIADNSLALEFDRLNLWKNLIFLIGLLFYLPNHNLLTSALMKYMMNSLMNNGINSKLNILIYLQNFICSQLSVN